MNISFIGFGHMAKAIAHGLKNDPKHPIRAASPSLSEGMNPDGILTYSNNLAVIEDANILVLAVKPAQIPAVFSDIHPKLAGTCLVISIAAGIPLSWFEKQNPAVAIVRAMPNLGATHQLSATPLIANQRVTHQQKKWAESLFSQIGITTWINKESEMDAFTALSGSGPAYVFLMMKAMIEAAITLGVEEQVAKSFTLQTFKGAVSLANQNLDELIRRVTSPGGTTAAATEVLKMKGFQTAIHQAMAAAYDKAFQLGANA